MNAKVCNRVLVPFKRKVRLTLLMFPLGNHFNQLSSLNVHSMSKERTVNYKLLGAFVYQAVGLKVTQWLPSLQSLSRSRRWGNVPSCGIPELSSNYWEPGTTTTGFWRQRHMKAIHIHTSLSHFKSTVFWYSQSVLG